MNTSKASKTSKRSKGVKDLGAKADPRGGRKPAHVHYYKPPPPARHPVGTVVHVLEP